MQWVGLKVGDVKRTLESRLDSAGFGATKSAPPHMSSDCLPLALSNFKLSGRPVASATTGIARAAA